MLGEGVLEPCPPGLEDRHACHYPYPYARPHPHPQPTSPRRDSPAPAPADADPVEALNWTGRVRVASPAGMQVGGFAAGALGLVVKDFLVLSVVPPEPARSPLIEHQHAQPIRLVTDPLEEDGVLNPGT